MLTIYAAKRLALMTEQEKINFYTKKKNWKKEVLRNTEKNSAPDTWNRLQEEIHHLDEKILKLKEGSKNAKPSNAA